MTDKRTKDETVLLTKEKSLIGPSRGTKKKGSELKYE